MTQFGKKPKNVAHTPSNYGVLKGVFHVLNGVLQVLNGILKVKAIASTPIISYPFWELSFHWHGAVKYAGFSPPGHLTHEALMT